MYARPDRLAAFLDAVDAGKVPLSDVDPARLQVAAGGDDAALRDRAAARLAKVQLGQRRDVVEAYKGALTLKGDPARGKATFQKTCVACHRLDGVGTEMLRSLRAEGLTMPAVIMTANPVRGFNEAARDAGAQGTVLKTGSVLTPDSTTMPIARAAASN